MLPRRALLGLIPRSAMIGALGLFSVNAVAAPSVEELRTAAKRPPKEPEAVLKLGRSLRRAGLFGDSVRVLRSGYTRATSAELGAALRLEAARAQIAAGQFKPAMNECATLRKGWRVKHQICEAEAQLLWRRASLALPAAESALEQAPRDYDALVAKGRALGQLGEPAPAEAALRAAIEVDPARHEAHRYLADLLGAAGRGKDALSELRKARTLAPEESDVALALGEALPNGAEAVIALEAALAIRPDYPEASSRLGFVLNEQGQTARAEQLLRSALGQKPRDAGSRAVLARVLLTKGDAESALREARAALSVVKNHAGAKLVEADALAVRGEIDAAIEAFELAAAYAPTDPAPHVHAARACLGHGRPTTAQAFATRANSTFPNWAPAWEVAGDVAREVGDVPGARAAYTKALATEGPVNKASIKQRLAALK